MNSSRTSRRRRYPSDWSAWEWSAQYDCYQRYRQRSPDQYEWDYTYQTETPFDASIPPEENDSRRDEFTTTRLAGIAGDVLCLWPGCSQRFGTVNERDRHHRTIHSNNNERPYECTIPGCRANVRSWINREKLKAHNKTWHGPYPCLIPGCPRDAQNGFATQADSDFHMRGEHNIDPSLTNQFDYSLPLHMFNQPTTVPQPSGSPNYIQSTNPYTTAEDFDPHYQVHASWEFKWGRVFKMLWSEPVGNGGGNIDESKTESVRSINGKRFHQKVRRFVIINAMDGHCICLPIMTYGGQGVAKNGVHANHHTVISTGKPSTTKREKAKGLMKKPIIVVPSNPRHKLDDMSRLNYAKTYTVEYNVKVWFIGKVDKRSEWQLATDYNNIHPPLNTEGVAQPQSEAPWTTMLPSTATYSPESTDQQYTGRTPVPRDYFGWEPAEDRRQQNTSEPEQALDYEEEDIYNA